jgi:hypothetical protein
MAARTLSNGPNKVKPLIKLPHAIICKSISVSSYHWFAVILMKLFILARDVEYKSVLSLSRCASATIALRKFALLAGVWFAMRFAEPAPPNWITIASGGLNGATSPTANDTSNVWRSLALPWTYALPLGRSKT